jgi:hypothetical protein
MSFEEEVYKSAKDMFEDNGGFAFNKKKYYNQEKLLPQQYFISREMFFYHLKKECPEVVNYLYYEVFPYFKEIYYPYINYYKKSNAKKKYIFDWTKFLCYTSQNANDNLIKFTRKLKDWGNKFNLDKRWIYNAVLVNMSSWIQFEERETDKTWVYLIPDFLYKKRKFDIEDIEDEFIKESINIALDNDIPFFNTRNKTVSIPAPRPEIEGLVQYRERLKDIIKERYEEEKNRIENEEYIKRKNKKDFRLDDHFKWLILSHVKGLKNREIIEMLNENNMEESNISHVVNDLKKILGL